MGVHREGRAAKEPEVASDTGTGQGGKSWVGSQEQTHGTALSDSGQKIPRNLLGQEWPLLCLEWSPARRQWWGEAWARTGCRGSVGSI